MASINPIENTEGETSQILLEEKEDSKEYNFMSNFTEILLNVIPTAAYLFAQLVMPLVNLRFIASNCSNIEVDGVGLGNTWLVATYLSLVLGLNTGTSTFGAQAFGAGNFRVFSLYFHRAFVMRIAMFFPSYALCFVSYYFFLLIGVEEPIAAAARDYCVYSALALIAMSCYDTFKAFVMAQNVFLPPMIVQGVICVTHYFWCLLFVEKLQLGIPGVCLAFGIAQLSGAICLFLYILVSKEFEETRLPPTKECLQGWWKQLKNEFYIASFMILEWLAYEFCTLISGQFDRVQIAAQAFTYAIVCALYTPTIGLSVVGSIYIGNALGLKDYNKAVVVTKALFTAAGIIVLFQFVLIFFTKDALARFLTPDTEVQEATIDALIIYLIFMPIDTLQLTITSILKGAGREKITALLYLIAFYLIGLGGAYIFGVIVKLYTRGIWLGVGGAITSMGIMAGLILWRTDYNYQIEMIETRLLKEEDPLVIENSSDNDDSSMKVTEA